VTSSVFIFLFPDPHPVLEIMKERGMDLVSGYVPGGGGATVPGVTSGGSASSSTGRASISFSTVPSFAGMYTTSDRDQRMLVALSNLNYLAVATIPALDDACRRAKNVPKRPNLVKVR
jgi:hypothetical protein